jgi:hypothetical protein
VNARSPSSPLGTDRHHGSARAEHAPAGASSGAVASSAVDALGRMTCELARGASGPAAEPRGSAVYSNVTAENSYPRLDVDERSEMAFIPGDHVLVEAESTERRPRRGVIEEVIRDEPHPRYQIRWEDGHKSIYTPSDGALRLAEPDARSA